MIIYTFQPQSLIDEINLHGHAFVEFTKTNLYLQTQIPGKNMEASLDGQETIGEDRCMDEGCLWGCSGYAQR